MARRPVLALLVLLLLLPGSASAAEVRLDFSGRGVRPSADEPGGFERISVYRIYFTAASGEANRLSATEQADRSVRIEDSGAPLHPGSNCTADGAAVVCRIPPPTGGAVAVVDADLGDGDDRTVTPIHGDVRGGPGDDTLVADSILHGGPGADTLTGTGAARLDYGDRRGGVNVTFDGQANDGEPGEGDDVHGTFGTIIGSLSDDVLQATGAPGGTTVRGLEGDDRLIGSAGGDWLEGDDGRDVLEGGGGDDRLIGGADADRTRGGAGTDAWDSGLSNVPPGSARPRLGITITPDNRPNDGRPGEGDDVGSDIENFRTGPGDDRITGTNAPNLIESGLGDDTIVARAGADRIVASPAPGTIVAGGGDDGNEGRKTIDAGRGEDSVEFPLGAGDTLRLRDGERDRASCSPRALVAIDADSVDDLARCAATPHLSPGSLVLRLSGGGATALRARCPGYAAVRCRGTLRLYERGRARLLATGRYRIRPGTKAVVRVLLAGSGRALLRPRSRIRFVATASPAGRRIPPGAAHARGVLLGPR